MFWKKLFKKNNTPFCPEVVKVCGMREAKNIGEVAEAGANWIGLIFYPKSKRYVSQVSTMAGIIPDVSGLDRDEAASMEQTLQEKGVKLCGVFVDDMPQTIVTRVVNYHLDLVQLHGEESPVMIDNLRRTLDPDIKPGIKIIKTISIASKADFHKCKEYEGHADYFLFDTQCSSKGGSGKHFDWSLLKAYTGHTPFLLSGGIGPDDVDAIRSLHHERCIGVDINSQFELSPAVKDAKKVKAFIAAIW